MARLKIKGIGAIPGNWQYIFLPLGSDASKYYRIPELNVNNNILIRIYQNKQDGFKIWPYYPEKIREKANTESLLLEDILTMGDEAAIEIYLYGYDKLSGARKLFKSKSYKIHDIEQMNFFDKND